MGGTMIIRPLLVAGVALASTGALVAGASAGLPVAREQPADAVAAVPAKRTITLAELALLASVYPQPLSDVTLDDVLAAFDGGYGPWIDDADPYYPTAKPSTPAGLAGAAYFLGDATLLTLIDSDLPLVSAAAEFAYSNATSYFFEVGAFAALHVALAEAAGGPGTPLAQLLQAIFNPLEDSTGFAALAALAPKPLSDVTFEDLQAAFDGDYGPWIDDADPYYPTTKPTTPTGFVGLAYFLSDAALLSVADAGVPLVSDAADFAFENVTSYLFEVGAFAALHVALAESTGGPDTAIGQLLQAIFNRDASGATLFAPRSGAAPEIDARAFGTADQLAPSAPTEVPKTQPKLLKVAPDGGVDGDAPASFESGVAEELQPSGSVDPLAVAGEQSGADDGDDASDDAAEPVEVKKKPKLNVKKENPLAGVAEQVNQVKKKVDDTLKAVSHGVQQLTNGAEAPKDSAPSDPKPDKSDEGGASDDGDKG